MPTSRKRARNRGFSTTPQLRFYREQDARRWEKELVSRPGYTGGDVGAGWLYGYIYTITDDTVQ